MASDTNPGNLSTTASLLIGGSVADTLDGVNDADWFKVHLLGTTGYQFAFLPSNGYLTTPSYLTLALYDATGQRVATATNSNGYPKLTYSAIQEGNYFIGISTRDSHPGSYTLSAKTVPFDDYIAAGKLEPGTPLSGVIGTSDDTDTFTFAAVPGELYQFQLTSTIASASWNVSGLLSNGGSTWSGQFEAGAATPAVTVRAAQGTGAYTLAIAALPDDHPANAAGAGAVAVGSTVTGRIDAPGDRDWFAVSMEAAIPYLVRASGASVSLAQASSPASQPLTTDGTFIPTTSGTYYFQVSSLTTGAYSFTVAKPADDAPASTAQAVPVGVGETHTGHVDYTRDADAYQVHLLNGHTYVVSSTFTPDVRSNYSVNFSLTPNPDRTYQPLRMITGYGGPEPAKLTALADFDLPLLAQASTAGTYTFTVTEAGLDDVGDDAAHAAPLAVGATRSGHIDSFFDDDVYAIPVQAGLTYQIDAKAADGSHLGLLARAALPADSGLVLVNGRTVYTAPSDGILYLAVRAMTGQDYVIQATTAPDDYTSNRATTGRLASNGAASGVLEQGYDQDWFAITLQAGTTYKLGGTRSDTGDAMQLSLLDSRGNLLDHSTYQPLLFTPELSGTYYVAVALGTPSPTSTPVRYTVTTAPGQADDHPTPSRVALGQVASGVLESSMDRDVYLVDVQPGHQYEIRYETKPPLSDHYSTIHAPFGYDVQMLRNGLLTTQANPGGYVIPDQAGTLRINLKGGIEGQAYHLSVVDRGLDDYPEAAPPAPNLAIGQTVHGMLGVPGDRDTFTVALHKGQTATFALGADDGSRPGWSLLATALGAVPGLKVEETKGSERYVHVTAYEDELVSLTASASANLAYHLAYLVEDRIAPHAFEMARTFDYGQQLAFHFSEPLALRPYDSTRHDQAVIRDSAGRTVSTFTLNEFYLKGNSLVFTVPQSGTGALKAGSYTLDLGGSHLEDRSGNPLSTPALAFQLNSASTAAADGAGFYAGTGDGRRIDGGAGLDTAAYAASADTFDITAYPKGGFEVKPHGKTYGDYVTGIERLTFSNGAQGFALDIAGTGGQAYRLYQAAFDRKPDAVGLGYWIDRMDHGTTLPAVAQSFIDSTEFTRLYGTSLTDAQFIDALYHNVLHRDGDASGVAYWNHSLAIGTTRADVLWSFSESPENVSTLATIIGNGFAYAPWAG